MTRPCWRRRNALAVCLLAAALACAASARADGDPASDVLLLDTVYAPCCPQPSTSVVTQLRDTTKAAKRAGMPIRVAVIGGPADLGSVPQVFGKPRTYARFLGEEDHFAWHDELLVVMPKGFGVFGPMPARKALRALRGIRIGAGPDGLVLAGVQAVPKLAAAAGHPISGPLPHAGGGGGGGNGTLVAALAVAAVLAALIAVALLWARRRMRVAPRAR